MFSIDNRISLKISGEAGLGVDSIGLITMKALKDLNYSCYGEREFASVIKGVGSNFQINFGLQKVRSTTKKHQIAVALDREGVLDCLQTLEEGGILIHAFDRWKKVIKDLPKAVAQKNLQIVEIPAREIATKNGGNNLMVNVILLGYLWKVLGLDLTELNAQIKNRFANKKNLIPINLECAKSGYEFNQVEIPTLKQKLSKPNKNQEPKILIDGNTAVALGAISGGVRNYYAYPMSPSTSILTYLASKAKQTSMVVKQAEDEITVAQLTLGSMHAGTRSMCATSGGGFDLMTETVSLAGMIEVPWVCTIVQRPGPATGLPTWTGQGDLNLAIFGGHGEFARLVLASSDVDSCYKNTQVALNLAERFQIPVIQLSEAVIGMSYSVTSVFENSSEIERNLLDSDSEIESSQRYQLTDSGVSPRWLPGTNQKVYFANGDEHLEDGSLTEQAEPSKAMIAKRFKKIKAIKKEIQEPVIYGPKVAKISFVGWGSTKNVVLDALDIVNRKEAIANYLHYEYIWPLKTSVLKDFFAKNSQVVAIEGNISGQLASLIISQTDLNFTDKFLKWDGRPFYLEEVLEYIYSKTTN